MTGSCAPLSLGISGMLPQEAESEAPSGSVTISGCISLPEPLSGDRMWDLALPNGRSPVRPPVVTRYRHDQGRRGEGKSGSCGGEMRVPPTPRHGGLLARR